MKQETEQSADRKISFKLIIINEYSLCFRLFVIIAEGNKDSHFFDDDMI